MCGSLSRPSHPIFQSFGAHLMPLFTKNQPEIWSSDRVQATLVPENTLDKCRTDPILLFVKAGIFGDKVTRRTRLLRDRQSTM
jgi:hypothetical protein